MEFVIGWSIFGVLVSVLFFIVSEAARRSKARAAARSARLAEERREEFSRKVKYNREHIPCETTPPYFHPINETVDRIIQMIGLIMYDDRGDRLRELDNYDDDSIYLVEMIKRSVMWFLSNPTGETISEECEVIREFLRKQFCISEESIEAVVGDFCREWYAGNC